MKISKADLVKLIIESNNQGYNLAVKHADRNYDEFSADYRKALDEERTKTEQAFDRGFKAAQGDYQAGLSQGRREALSDEALASAKSQAYEAGYARAQEEAHKVGYQRGLAEGQAQAQGRGQNLPFTYEKGQAEGYKRGVEDQGRKTLELMKEARKAGREQALGELPKLSVWFMPCGPSPKPPETYPPGIDKLEAIKAIRWAYGCGEGYGLKEVKGLVEIEPGTLVSCGEPLPQSKAAELYFMLQAAGFEVVLRKP